MDKSHRSHRAAGQENRMNTVYLNGTYLAKQDATISIMDRGFLFGDGIYEVIPVHHGHFIGCKAHFERLQRSLAALQLTCPFTDLDAFKSVCCELLSRNDQTDDCAIYIQITRGAEEHRQHRMPHNIAPTVVAFLTPAQSKSTDQLQSGFKAITRVDLRRDDNYIKSTALMSNVALYEAAVKQGAIEAILLRNGYAIECTSSNLFIVKNGILMTPPLSDFILAGVTRAIVLELAQQNGLQTLEIDISESLLRSADEIWITGSVKEICPIVQLDDQAVNNGHVGPLWQQMHSLYQPYKESQHD